MIYYGHTHPDYANDPARWEPLPDHLNMVSALAGGFAGKFKCAAWAEKLGLWHDFGKFSAEFQRYLAASNGDSEESDGPSKSGRGPDHSTAGAKYVAEIKPGLGHLLAYAIAGHHAGLPDGLYGQNLGVSNESTLESRLKHREIKAWIDSARAALPPDVFDAPSTNAALRQFLADGYAASFWVRMMFSCLVDADFLATETFMNERQAKVREAAAPPSLGELEAKLSAHMTAKSSALTDAGLADSAVNRIRAEVRNACLDAAEQPPGLFSLTVPTGGGKTLASLAFALKHAREHGLERIVYVIPFTSIIEQNAAVFREALGDDAVLEHHSNFISEPDDHATSEERQRAWQTKLAAENWDAPVIVTTGVQFFESLHAHKPSRCRKLHRLAKAVVILDEAQTLPVPLLQPCLRSLEQLAKNYGSTVVLCTATQPAIGKRDNFPCGLSDIREIIPSTLNLHERLRRVTVTRIAEPLTDADLAIRLAQEDCVLAVVNTRRHARELFEKLRVAVDESATTPVESRTVYHLSAQMCPVHRTEILNRVRTRLRAGHHCRLISTQLIEAGVDVDFPCVYRAEGGLDAIAQAAGRCNREGRLAGEGRVFVFKSTDHKPPAGFLRQTAETGAEVLAIPEYAADALSPESMEKYFRLLYWRNYSHDETGDQTNFIKLIGCAGERRPVVGGLLRLSPPKSPDDCFGFAFRTLGENFRLIEETSETVIIPYGESGSALCELLRKAHAPAERMKLLRRLQRYAVSIPKPVFAKGIADGTIQKVHDSFAVLVSPEGAYSAEFGVALDDRAGRSSLLLL